MTEKPALRNPPAFNFRDNLIAGLVMRTLRNDVTGEELAAVLAPTSPIPTSGYLQIAPTKNLTPTDMSMDQAMTVIVSGGPRSHHAPASQAVGGQSFPRNRHGRGKRAATRDEPIARPPPAGVFAGLRRRLSSVGRATDL
jgi:hypothetical protein